MPSDDREDWTHGAAKWFAVILLGSMGALALAWSVIRGHSPPVFASSPILPAAVDRPGTNAVNPHTEPRPPTAPSAAHAKKININTATQAELELLPGIGPALAGRIIERRAARGPFRSVDQLDDVRGIGPKLLAKIRPQVSLE